LKSKHKHPSLTNLVNLAFGLVFATVVGPFTLRAETSIIDSLKQVIETAQDDSNKVIILNQLCWEYEYQDQNLAKKYVMAANDLAHKLDYQRGLVSSYILKGHLAADLGQHELAIKQYQTSLKFANKLNYAKGIANSYVCIGLIYDEQHGNYPRALNYYLSALKLYEQIGAKRQLGMIYNNIGTLYSSIGDDENAMEYNLKSLKIKKERGNTRGMAYGYSNVGLIHKKRGDYSKALDHYFKALRMLEVLDDSVVIATVYMNISSCYYLLGIYPVAKKYLLKGLKISEDLREIDGAIAFHNWLGLIYMKLGKFHESEHYLKLAEGRAEHIEHLENLRFAYEGLSALYDTTSRYDLALHYFKLYQEVKDSLFNETKSKEIGKLEARHEFEMEDQERKRMEEERSRILIAQTERRNLLQYSGILIFIVAFFITLLYSGKLNIPIQLAEGGVFFAFLLIFEFLLVLTDPSIEQYTGGEPAYKLLINAGLAGLIFPLHSIAETKLKQRIFSG